MTALLAAALVEAQKDMPAVDKTGTGNFGKHVTLDHLIAKTRQHLQKHGLAIAQFPATSEVGAPSLRTVLMHTSGESIQADTPLFLDGKNTMQALGGAITYARRYGWSSVLGISTEEDDDGDSVSSSVVTKPAVAPQISAEEKTRVAEKELLFLKLVEEKGGDVPTSTASMDTSRGKPAPHSHEAWLDKGIDHWGKKFVAPTPRVPAGAA